MPGRKAADPLHPKTSKRRPRQKLPKFTQKRAAGRPMIYEAEAHCARAHSLALLGLTDVEIAFQFGIAPSTLEAWQKKHPRFSEALNSGKVPADAEVAKSMFKRAIGYDHPAVKIFAPQELGGEPIYAPHLEHYPGDVGAQKSWLFNRQGMRWRDRQQVEVSGTLEHRISQMTPEQRLERLRELQAKLDRSLTIEHEPDEE